MAGHTPQKQRDVLQVPGSSPLNRPDKSDAAATRTDEKHKTDMRTRFYSHKFWPIISKRFYYLSEPELFRAMVKGKGNLRDISQWLAENIPLNERMLQYEEKQQRARPTPESKPSSGLNGIEHRISSNSSSTYEQPNGSRAEVVAVDSSPITEPQHRVTSPPTQSYDEEDASPVKSAGKARQKRTLSELPVAPDTKVHLSKPKVSILEKYRNRQQPRIDQIFKKPDSDDAKRRRLVRADRLDGVHSTATSHGVAHEETFTTAPHTSAIPSLSTPGSLTKTFGYQDSDIPRPKFLKPSEAEVDELDLLEEKIRANRKKKKSGKAYGDDDLEEDIYSDDMSAEEDDNYTSGLTSIDAQIVDFLNHASAQDLSEICNVPPKIADLIVSKRPIQSIYEFSEERFAEATPEPETKRKNQRKALGMKIIQSTAFSLKGYKAVDSLVKKCSEYGNLISKQMDRWGVKVTGEGELDLIEVGKTPDEGDVIDADEEDDDLSATKRSLPYIRHKPTLLAEDIELKTYQQVGINWLHLLYHNKLSCILADEMGLGKTCQVISFMAYLKATSDRKNPHLVVVPSSTLENWLREFHKFCPDLTVQAYYGSQGEREDLRYELMENEYDVLVTTYNLATGAAPDFKFLKGQNFDMIVYDEGHMLKNSSSERYNKLMRLKAGFRLLLTGTPLQNNLKELVSLLAFMLPGLFVEKREDLQGLFNKKASVDASGDYNPLLSQQAIKKAKTMMTPFVLRRKKAQVLKYLPGKHHEIVRCEMTNTQREIYDEYIKQGKQSRLQREKRKASNGKAKDDSKNSPAPSSSNVMMSLRKAAMHPLLFRKVYSDEKLKTMAKKIMREPAYVDANQAYILEDMMVMSDYELNALCEKFPKTLGAYQLEKSKWHDSGKVVKLLELIDAVIVKKEKILVFSLFTQMLDILEKILSYANISFLRLDGQTSVDTRQDIIDRFYEDDTIPVFLLSTKAGGFGINLVAANNVVIFDQSFNPHDDKQAEDRAHRVGQTQEVLVTKLISENTIDENILLLADNKLQLDQSISDERNESKFEEKAASMFEKLLFDEQASK